MMKRSIILFAAVPIFGCVPWYWGTEEAFQWAGTAFQVVGVCTVAWGIRETRKTLGQDGLIKQLLSSLAPKRHIIMQAEGTAYGMSVAAGEGFVAPAKPAHPTIEDRLNDLSEKVELHKQQTDRRLNDVQTKLTSYDGRLSEEAKTREEVARHLATLQSVTTSGLNLSAFGVICLIVGIVYGTLPTQLHCFAFWLWKATH